MAVQISIPAGRSTRRGETKFVDADPTKGVLELRSEDGEFTHFSWKSRASGQVEDELLIFPGEATFTQVEQDPSGRTHILKFTSSDQKYFFWIQKNSREAIARAQVDIDNLIRDPNYLIGSAPLPQAVPSTPLRTQERSWPPTPGAPRLSHPEPAPRAAAAAAAASASTPSAAGSGSSMEVDAAQAQETPAPAGSGSQSDMARMLAEWARAGGIAPAEDEARLTDVLSPVHISTLLSTQPNLISTITPLLPQGLDLPTNPSAQDLLPILSAPQFTDAIASLDNALRSGGLPGGMMRELGLPENAGQSVKGFLDGLVGLSKPQEGSQGQGQGADERMDED